MSGLQLESVLQEPPHTDVSKTRTMVTFHVSSHFCPRDNAKSVFPGSRKKDDSGPKGFEIKVHVAVKLENKVPKSEG